MLNFSKRTFLIDLDNTLYSSQLQPELVNRQEKKITSWLSKKYDINYVEANNLKIRIYKRYGGAPFSFLKSKVVTEGSEFISCVNYINSITVPVLQKEFNLKLVLGRLNADLFLFTNSLEKYASSVLKRLYIEDLFTDIFDISASNYLPKNNPVIYKYIYRKLNMSGNSMIFVDDNIENLLTAKSASIGRCVWLKRNSGRSYKGIEEISNIKDLT